MATKKETKPTKEIKAKKEIVLASSYPHLSIFTLGVQFIDGRFTTTDRTLADKILTFDGVFEL